MTDATATPTVVASTAAIKPLLGKSSSGPLASVAQIAKFTSSTIGGNAAVRVTTAITVPTLPGTFTNIATPLTVTAVATTAVMSGASSGAAAVEATAIFPEMIGATATTITPLRNVSTTTIGATASATENTTFINPSTVAAVTSIGAVFLFRSEIATPSRVISTAAITIPTMAQGMTATPSQVAAVTVITVPTMLSSAIASPRTVSVFSQIPTPSLVALYIVTPARVVSTSAIGALTTKAGGGATPITVRATSAIGIPTIFGIVVSDSARTYLVRAEDRTGHITTEGETVAEQLDTLTYAPDISGVKIWR